MTFPVKSGLGTNCRCTCWDLFGRGHFSETKLLQNCSFSQHMDKQEYFVQEFISSLSESLSIFKLLSPDLNFEVLIQLGLKCNGKTWKVFPSFCF
jgi:hypothetical protein